MPEHGGKRTPGNPAPVSGPGQLSQRTDGGPQQVMSDVSGMPYGENQELEEMQSAAPLSASPSAQSPRARQRQARSTGRKAGDMGATPLMSPTQRPDEPVTAGAPVGPGPNPSMFYREPQTPRLSDTMRKIEGISGDPTISRIAQILSRRGL